MMPAFFQNPDEAFSSKMDPFRMGSVPILADWR
jgi:hypothetical protein